MRTMKTFLSNRSGVALIEFAIVLPVLLLMLVGMVEATRFAIINQKLDKVANSMSDFVTQGYTIGTSNLNSFAQAVTPIMSPFSFTGTVIFSSVVNYSIATPPCAANIPCISWQYKVLGGDASRLGNVGSAAATIGGYNVISGQNIIVTEVFMQYTPLLSATSNLMKAFNAQTLYKVAVYKPRQGTMTTLGQ